MSPRMMGLCIVWAVGAWFSLTAHAQGMRNFNAFPELPYEATSYAHDEWIEIARRSGGRDESAPLEACRQLLADESTPWEIQRWALRRRVDLLSTTYRENDALREGREWLNANPDDPEALLLRFVLLQMACQNGHPGFSPDIHLVRSLLADLRLHHDPKQMLVVRARVEVARKMQHFELLGEPSARLERRLQLEAARDTALLLAEREESTEQERTSAANYLEHTILPMLAPPPRHEPERLTREEAEQRIQEVVEQIMEEQGITKEELLERYGPK